MKGLTITVFNSPSEIQQARQCSKRTLKFSANKRKHVRCRKGTVGRYVRLTMARSNKRLSLCEIQIYGKPGKTGTYRLF